VKVLAAASQELEIAPDDLEVVDGVVRAIGAPDRSITVEEIVRKALRFGGRYEPIEGHGGSAQDRRPRLPPFARASTGRRARSSLGTIAQDVGRALNPASSRARCAGATQGMGGRCSSN
jgi:hypothetical protein